MTIQLDTALGAGARDRALVNAHLSGDDDAFSLIAEDHYDALRAQARRLLGPSGQAEDAVQETFERALKGIRRFGLTGEYRLGAWLSRILSNVCADQRSRLSREMRIAQAMSFEVDYEADVADVVSDPIVVARVKDAMRGLPATHLQALMLHELDGLPYAAVAEEANISVENARARVSRAKSSLQGRLSSLRSSAGLIGIPFLRRFAKSTDKSASFVSQSGPASPPASGLMERLASQFTATPFGQTAMALIASAPKGTVLVGVAATVATVSLGTTVLNPVSPPNASNPVVHAASFVPAALTTPATPPPTAPTSALPPTGATTPAATGYSWANPATPAVAAPIVLATATCYSANGVPAPGSGFNSGPSLGMANALSVASLPTIDLPTTGPAVALSSGIAVTAFGSSSGQTRASLAVNACLAQGGWMTAALTTAGGSATLQGVLSEVIGTPGDLGYIFRGTVTPGAAGPGSDLLAATQFVAQLELMEPANTATLTVVFLSPQPALGAIPAAPGVPASADAVGSSAPASPSPPPDPTGTSAAGDIGPGSLAGYASLGSNLQEEIAASGSFSAATFSGAQAPTTLAALGLLGLGSPPT